MKLANATDERLATRFLPARRSPLRELARQRALLESEPLVQELLDGSLSLTMILNENRQILLVNGALRERLGIGKSSLLDARMGDCFGCVHAEEAPSGCGTTESCRDCGAAQAVAGALIGRVEVKNCRIRTVICGRDLDLLTRASPFLFAGEEFVLLSSLDVEPELRRRALEKIFFHDVLNTANGVQGVLHAMKDADDDEMKRRYLPVAVRASDTLIDELLSQRDLTAAESGELQVDLRPLATAAFLGQLAALFASHSLAKDRTVAVDEDAEDLALTTDKTLLSRVVVNLIKNALEAEPRGGRVSVGCRSADGLAVISVRNSAGMAPEVGHQVFQRSFSTKGRGRGLGTYSVRLLTENYLGGKASFASDAASGTIFRVELPLKPDA